MVAHLAVILLGRNDYMKLNTASSSSVSLSDDRPFSVDCIFFFMGVSSNTTDQTHTRPSSLHTTLLLHYRIGSTMYMHSSAHTLSLTTVHTTHTHKHIHTNKTKKHTHTPPHRNTHIHMHTYIHTRARARTHIHTHNHGDNKDQLVSRPLDN